MFFPDRLEQGVGGQCQKISLIGSASFSASNSFERYRRYSFVLARIYGSTHTYLFLPSPFHLLADQITYRRTRNNPSNA